MHIPLIFIRHGQTDWNRELRFQGMQDIPLNDLGRRQAARNGRAIAGILRAGDWRIVASPLGRTVETTRIVLAAAGQPDLPFTTDALLREASYGDWEGMTLAEIAERHPAESGRRDLDKWGHAPPAGESYAAVAERGAGWLVSLDRPTLIVSHGGVLRGLLHNLAGMPGDIAAPYAVAQDRVFLFTGETVLTI